MPITDRDKKTLIIGGSVVGFMLLAFLIYKLFLSGGGGTAAVSVGPPVIPASATGTPSSTLSPTPSPTPAVVTFGGVDPFCTPQSYVSREIYLQIPLALDGYYCPGVVIPITPSPTTPPPTTPPTSSPTSSPTSPPVGSAPIQSSVTFGGRTVVLKTLPVSSLGRRAQVEVNGKLYYVAVGSVFAQGSLKLQGVSDPCASFLYGDQAFSLCTP